MHSLCHENVYRFSLLQFIFLIIYFHFIFLFKINLYFLTAKKFFFLYLSCIIEKKKKNRTLYFSTYYLRYRWLKAEKIHICFILTKKSISRQLNFISFVLFILNWFQPKRILFYLRLEINIFQFYQSFYLFSIFFHKFKNTNL